VSPAPARVRIAARRAAGVRPAVVALLLVLAAAAGWYSAGAGGW